MSNFALRMKELRKEKKIKQIDMAKFLGVSLRSYQYYESAEHYPDLPGVVKLADYFDVSMDYLTGRTDQR